MKENEEIINEAKRNIEGFDFVELDKDLIFNVFKKELVNAFAKVTKIIVKSEEQISWSKYIYDVCQERDLKNYPFIEMRIEVKSLAFNQFYEYYLIISPFNCHLGNHNNINIYGGHDKELTKVWRDFMRTEYGEKWVEAFKDYCNVVRRIKNTEATKEMTERYAKNQKEYEEELNSIAN